MTILVIELSVPVVTKLKAAEELGGMLLEMWPKFLAFAISFLVLGILWFTHHAQFHFIKRSNGKFAWMTRFLFDLYRRLSPSWQYMRYTALWLILHPSRRSSTWILLYPYRTLARAISSIRILRRMFSFLLAIYRWVDKLNLISLQHQRSLI